MRMKPVWPILIAVGVALAGCASATPKLPPEALLAPKRDDLPPFLKTPCSVPVLKVGDDVKAALALSRDRLKSCADKKAAVVKLYLGTR